MNTYDLQIYVNALFVLMIASILVFILVSRKIDSSEIPAISLKHYHLYFTFGIVGWIALWIKDVANIHTNLAAPVTFYVLISYFLFIAIAECSGKNTPRKRVTVIHIVLIIGSLLLPNDADRILYLTTYTLLVYPIIAYLAALRARRLNNIGSGIIAAAATLMVLITPFQFHGVLVEHNPGLAYGLSLIGSSTGFMLVGIGFVTSVMVSANNKLSRLALHDPLTGLYNRRGMDLALQIPLATAQRSGQIISAIAMDLDYFKAINDNYGHDSGDFVLKQLADTILKYSRPGDVSCRLGGEEFVIIMPETSREHAALVAERIRHNIETLELKHNGNRIRLSSSFGVAAHVGDMQIDHLIKDADKALYEAKANGRNQVRVNEDDNRPRVDINDIRSAHHA